MKRIVGYLFLVLSFGVWGVIVVFPFTRMSVSNIALFTTILAVSGEVLFVMSLALLGREVWEYIKSLFKKNKIDK
jgi:hypothetical protein